MPSFPTAILVADDGSAEADLALETALELTLTTGSSLSLVHVRSLSPSMVGTAVTREQERRIREEGENLVERRASEVAERGVPLEHVEMRLSRRIESAITDTAERIGAGLLVVGARGGPGRRHLMGDISYRLVREAHCSVLVVQGAQTRRGPRIGPEQAGSERIGSEHSPGEDDPGEGDPGQGLPSGPPDQTDQRR